MSAEDLWVFGYGSLMWRPGFAYLSRHKARVTGWTRRLCVFSQVYRGTPERPGLVLGLDAGGSCEGVVFRVSADRREETLKYLRDRELVTNVYLETTAEAKFDEGGEVRTVTYVADRHHVQYTPPMPRGRLLAIISGSAGQSGPNAEYVLNTHDHLVELGIADEELSWLAARLRGE